jgi:hypothetical protein
LGSPKDAAQFVHISFSVWVALLYKANTKQPVAAQAIIGEFVKRLRKGLDDLLFKKLQIKIQE